MVKQLDISELFTQYDNPDPDISEYIDLNALQRKMKDLTRRAIENLTETENSSFFLDVDDDISAISNLQVLQQEHQEYVSKIAHDRLKLLIRSYASPGVTEEDSRYEMLTEKLKHYLPPVPREVQDTLQSFTADLAAISHRAEKRNKFLNKIT